MPVIFPNQIQKNEEMQVNLNRRFKAVFLMALESDAWFNREGLSEEERNFTRRLYQAHHQEPLWFESIKLRAYAKDLVDLVNDLTFQGVNPAPFKAPRLLEPLSWAFETDFERWSDPAQLESLAELEIVLTSDLYKVYRILRYGAVDPGVADPEWFLSRPKRTQELKFEKWISLIKSGEFKKYLEDLAPHSKQYSLLKESLKVLQQRLLETQTPNLPETLKLKKGDRNSHYVPILRKRLQILMDYPDSPLSTLTSDPLDKEAVLKLQFFDDALETAVRHFQWRHGLKINGQINRDTIKELNVPLSDRIDQIKVNLERWRWMPRNMPQKLIVVNTAEYKLYFWDVDHLAISMNVVVGQEYRETPSFQSEIQMLETNPKWHVPHSIAIKDILPKFKKSSGVLVKQGFRIFDPDSDEEIKPSKVDWKKVSPEIFPYKIVQDAGPLNALGRIKFWLPNSFGIYLHDTPTKELFDRRVRTFSSGCIRLEMPLTLAKLLLEGSEEWSGDRLETEIESGKNTKIIIPESVPIFIVYWTAWVTDDGTIHFRPDIYDRNGKILSLL